VICHTINNKTSQRALRRLELNKAYIGGIGAASKKPWNGYGRDEHVIEPIDFRLLVCTVGALLAFAPSPAAAQGFTASNAPALLHRDFAAKPCLQVNGISRAHVMAPTVFDHVLDIENRCIQAIKAKVCYHKTEQCIVVKAQGRTRKEYVLGSFPAMSQFRYDVKEQPDAPGGAGLR
jgi:hypothetical protein